MILLLKTKLVQFFSWLSLAAGVLLVAYYKGRSEGSEREKEKVKESVAKAVEIRKEVDANVENSNDSDIDKRGSRWVLK